MNLRFLSSLLVLMMLALGGTTDARAQQSRPAAQPQDDLAALIDDLSITYAQSLASQNRGFLLESQQYRRQIDEFRRKLRRSSARSLELEQRLRTFSWVQEPRFREAMIAYRALVTSAVQAAGPQELEGWRLLARGDPSAGLELLRENARLRTEAERTGAALAREAVERAGRLQEAERLRIIAIEAGKFVSTHRLPIQVAIADWRNVVATDTATRADHVILSSLLSLDGDDDSAEEQRVIAATLPRAERDSRLDELLGGPSETMLNFIVEAPDAADPIAAITGYLGALLAARPAIGPAAARALQSILAGSLSCVDFGGTGQRGDSIASRCLPILRDASTLALRLARRRNGASPRQMTAPGEASEAGERAFLFAARLSEIITLALTRNRQERRASQELTERLRVVAGGLNLQSRASQDEDGDRADWLAVREAIAPLLAQCPRYNASMAEPCTILGLNDLVARSAMGEEIGRAEIEALARPLASRQQVAIAAGGDVTDAPASLRQLRLDQRASVEILSRLDPAAGLRVASARLQAVLGAGRGPYPLAPDDAQFLNEIVWYEEFVGRHGTAFARVEDTAHLYEIFAAVLAERPRATASCREVVALGDALVMDERTISMADLQVLQHLYRAAERCGARRISGPVPDDDVSLLSYLGSFRSSLAWGVIDRDVATARTLANLVAFGTLEPPPSRIFGIPDRHSFLAYDRLADLLERGGNVAEEIRVRSLTFETAASLAEADPGFAECVTCLGAAWRPAVGLIGATLGLRLEQAGEAARSTAVYRRMVALGSRVGYDLYHANLFLGRHAMRERRFEEAVGFYEAAADFQRRQPAHVLNGVSPIEIALRDLIQALDASGRNGQAQAVSEELVSLMLAAIDRGGFQEDLPWATMVRGIGWCAGFEDGIQQWSCNLRFHAELLRRVAQPGVSEAIGDHAAALRRALSSHRGRRRACAALARFPNREAGARIAQSLALVCPTAS